MRLKTELLTEPTFVGRESEMRELVTYLDSAMSGNGKTVFVSGEAGTGKTRLVNEFLAVAKKREISLLIGWCLSNATMPYFPFIQAFDSFLPIDNEENGGALSQKLGLKSWLMGPSQLQKESEATMPEAWKDQAFAAVTKALLNISASRSTVLVLEDLHWADSASILLLHYISRAASSSRLLILATFRSEELNVDPSGHPHPLTDVLRLMKKDNLLNEIRLSNLTQLNVEEIAESMLCGKIHEELTEKLAQESQGNPLFIIESLRMLGERENLVREKDLWRLSVDSIGIPPKVKDVILRRLGNLKLSERRILDFASVIGDRFNPQLLGTLLDEDSLQILETLNAIMQSTSLVCVEGDSYWFDHSKSREVLYEEIPVPLKVGYHERIAEKMESAREEDNIPVSELAYHYAEAGKENKAVKYALAAGEEALAKFANIEAVKHFTYVLQTVSDKSEYAHERIQALEGLGDALFARGLFEDAARVFEQVSDLADQSDLKLRTLRKAMVASRWRGDLAHSLELANKAQEYAGFDRLEYARIRALRGTITGLRGNTERGLTDLEGALKIFEEEYSLPDLTNTLYQTATFYATEYQVEKALEATARSVSLCEDSKDIREQMETHFQAGNVFFNCRLFKEALDNYEKAIKKGEIVGDYNTVAWAYVYEGVLLESIGDFAEAISKTTKGNKLAEKTDAFYIQSMAHANLTIQYSRLGDLENAKEHYANLMKYFPEISQSGSKVAKAAIIRAKAVFLAAQEQYSEANTLFAESLALHTAALYSKLYETITRTEYAWALLKEGKTEDAQTQTKKVEKIHQELEEKIARGTVHADLLARKKVETYREFPARLDIVNVTKNPVTLLRVDGFTTSDLKITELPAKMQQQDFSITLNSIKVNPFKVEPVTVTLKATKSGTLNLNPRVVYVDGSGKTIICAPDPVRIVAKSASPETEEASQLETPSAEFEFKTDVAEEAFRFLVTAFVEDYMRRRLPSELSGWRTLNDIVKHGNVSKRMVYGGGNYRGRAISELERRGLVEIRVFPGERGRGGRILKIKIFYENDIVRRHIDDAVMKIGKN
jgi:predicted ATPase